MPTSADREGSHTQREQGSQIEQSFYAQALHSGAMTPEVSCEIEELIRASIKSGLFPGAAWLVEEGGRELGVGWMGHAEIAPGVRKMSRSTIFDLASLTKPVCTATLCLLMRDRGSLSFQEKVSAYVPSFSGGWRDGVRVSQLLSHSSGLPSGLDLRGICSDPSEVLDRVCEVQGAYPPGGKTLYSDVGYILLGKLLEGLLGSPLSQLARDQIFDPLGMSRTVFCPAPWLRQDIASTLYLPEQGKVLTGEVHDGNARFMGGVSGHAGLFSCLDDLRGFCRMMLGLGTPLLARGTIEEATRIWAADGENAYGLSWFKRRSGSSPFSLHFSEGAYGHTGYTGTSIFVEPERDLFAILLTNRIHPKDNRDRISEMNMVRREFHELALGV